MSIAFSPNPGVGQRVTLADVARASGLAKSTISKALNHPADRGLLSEETRAKALEAAALLGYRPTWAAQALRRQSTQTIGLLHWARVPDGGSFWHGMLEALVDRLHEHGYDLQFIANSEHAADVLCQGRFDGCIIAHRVQPEIAETIRRIDLPAVLLNADNLEDGSFSAPSVRPDDVDAGLQLGRYLIELGHRRLAFADTHGTMRHRSYADRIQGLGRAFAEAGLTEAVEVYKEPVDRWIDRAARRADSITAIVTYDDIVAMQLLSGLWRSGLRVPEQISVATFNDTAFTGYAIPALTTMRMPTQGMAACAVDLLLSQLSGNVPAARSDNVMLPAELVVRSSTGPVPIGS